MQKATAYVLRRYAGEQLVTNHFAFKRAEAARRGKRLKTDDEICNRLAGKLSAFLKLEACDVVARSVLEVRVE